MLAQADGCVGRTLSGSVVVLASNHQMYLKELKRRRACYLYADIYHSHCSSFVPHVPNGPFCLKNLF